MGVDWLQTRRGFCGGGRGLERGIALGKWRWGRGLRASGRGLAGRWAWFGWGGRGFGAGLCPHSSSCPVSLCSRCPLLPPSRVPPPTCPSAPHLLLCLFAPPIITPPYPYAFPYASHPLKPYDPPDPPPDPSHIPYNPMTLPRPPQTPLISPTTP